MNGDEDLRDLFDKHPWRLYDLIYHNHPKHRSKFHGWFHEKEIRRKEYLLGELYLDNSLWKSMFVELMDPTFDVLFAYVVFPCMFFHRVDRLWHRVLETKRMNEIEIRITIIYLVAFCTMLFEEDFSHERFPLRVSRVDPSHLLESHRDKGKLRLVDRLIVRRPDYQ